MSDESQGPFDLADISAGRDSDIAFEEDWARLAERYSQEGIPISQSPRDELSSGQIETILKTYEQNRIAGEQKARESLKSVLERRKESVHEMLDSLVDNPEETKQEADHLGEDDDLFKKYLGVGFQNLAAATRSGIGLAVYGSRRIINSYDNADKAAAEVLSAVPGHMKMHIRDVEIGPLGIKLHIRASAPDNAEQEFKERFHVEGGRNVEVKRDSDSWSSTRI